MTLVRARIRCVVYAPEIEGVWIRSYVRCYGSHHEMQEYLLAAGQRTLRRALRRGRGLVVLGATEVHGELQERAIPEVHHVH